jgi:exodeoxyribonuclease V alpha subunit
MSPWLNPLLPLSALDRALASLLVQRQPGDDPALRPWHGLLAALVSHRYAQGHACVDVELLPQSGPPFAGWDDAATIEWPQPPTSLARSLPWTQGVGSPLVLDVSRLYLRRNWLAEQGIRQSIAQRMAQVSPTPSGLRGWLDALFSPQGQLDMFPAQPGAEPMPDWQRAACALAVRGRLTLITGGPGTGKTTTVVRLLALLNRQAQAQGQPLRIALAAPTGKAAARLAESVASARAALPVGFDQGLPTSATTLHRLLGIRPDASARPSEPLALDVVVVDEASMIDLDAMARLMQAVPLSARLVLLGDKDQLASVEAGAVMAQLCSNAAAGHYTPDTLDWLARHAGVDVAAWAGPGSALAQHTVMLRHSRRFDARSGIGRWAALVNAGDVVAVQSLWRDTPAASSTPVSAEAAPDVQRLTPQQPADAALQAWVRHGWSDWLQALAPLRAPTSDSDWSDGQALDLLERLARFQLLCVVRDGPWGVHALNRLAVAALGFGPALPADGWYVGRPVMVGRNDPHLLLMNGDVGLCLPRPEGLRVAFPDGQGGIRWVLPARLDAVETTFAMTVHKSQGSEFGHVAVVLPGHVAAVATRELLYTAITRARQRLTLVVPQPGVLWHAVAHRVERSGGLHTLHAEG